MIATAEAVHPVFTPRSGESWRNPWPMYAALREHDPVHHVVPEGRPDHDYWVLSRYDDVLAAARDWETFSSAQGLTIRYDEMVIFGDSRPIVMMDPPQHSALRRMLHKAFTPKSVAALEPRIRRFVVERIEHLRRTGGGDIAVELFKPLPSMVVADYLGVPADDDTRARFDAWSTTIVAGAVGNAHVVEIQAATDDLFRFFTTLAESRRRNPADDTVSSLVQAGLDEGGTITNVAQVLGWAYTMITGGNDTMAGMLGGSALLLTRHRDQRQKLLDDPTRIGAAVEELLRFTSPVQGLCRTATQATEIGGVTIPAGRKILLLYASANHDPRKFGPDADELDVVRDPKGVLTFSHGPHHCIGNAVARLQSRIVLEELLARCPHFTVDCDAVQYAGGMYTRRPVSVPLAVA